MRCRIIPQKPWSLSPTLRFGLAPFGQVKTDTQEATARGGQAGGFRDLRMSMEPLAWTWQ